MKRRTRLTRRSRVILQSARSSVAVRRSGSQKICKRLKFISFSLIKWTCIHNFVAYQRLIISHRLYYSCILTLSQEFSKESRKHPRQRRPLLSTHFKKEYQLVNLRHQCDQILMKFNFQGFRPDIRPYGLSQSIFAVQILRQTFPNNLTFWSQHKIHRK